MPERGLPGGAAVGPHRHRADQIDPDWLYALQHVLPQIDARTYVSEDPASGGAELPFRADINAPVPSPSRERSKRRAEEENLSADVSPIPSPSRARSKCRMEEENPSAEIPWYEANPNIDKDFRVFFQHARMVNGRLVLEKDGQVVRYEQVVESADGAFALGEKEKVAVTSTNGPASESEFPSESHGRGFSAFCQKGLHGVVWPTHIMKRPESRFKERLMQVLSKPFSQREYDQLVHRASIHIAATKERRTRAGVKYFPSTHEKNKSYFDSFPDLEEQVKSTSYPNQLSLLRGFFFWLKNIGHEDQFRPWRDDFTHYKVISSME